jgi:hypothetical protein
MHIRCVKKFLSCFDRFRHIDVCQMNLFTFFYIYCKIKRGVYVTSRSTKHTIIIDLFFEDTCLQVIQVWKTVISFRFWVINDDVEVL